MLAAGPVRRAGRAWDDHATISTGSAKRSTLEATSPAERKVTMDDERAWYVSSEDEDVIGFDEEEEQRPTP